MYSQAFVSAVFGSVLGFAISIFYPHHFTGYLGRHKICGSKLIMTHAMNAERASKLCRYKPLFIGVMTSANHLDTRAKGLNKTWASELPGAVEYFVGNAKSFENKSKQLPIRVLREVNDNEYPPQKKVMAMLKYMYKNYIDEYQWFMRADDDVYVRTDELKRYLQNLDGFGDTVIGQGGIGKRPKVHKLGLVKHECYCLGGPGVIMSGSVLRKIGPNLDRCLNEMVSNHEDVELGRCIRKYAGISCLWAEEAKELFQQVYDHQEKAYHGNLDSPKINKALTLHPVKDPAYMFRLHYHFTSLKLFRLYYHGYKTNGILKTTKEILSGKINSTSFASRSRNTDFFFQANSSSKLAWEFITQKNKNSASMKHYNLKSHSTLRYLGGMQKTVGTIMYDLNEKFRKTSRRETKSKISFENIQYGYLRINPKYGVQCQLSLSIKMPHPPLKYRWAPSRPIHHWAQQDQAFLALQGRIQAEIERETVHFIVPLSKKLKEFTRFLASLKDAFLIYSEPIAVLIVYFPESFSSTEYIQLINKYQQEFPQTEFQWLQMPGSFNRARALQQGVEYLRTSSLVFFSDVDLVFQPEFVYRCRGNTIRGKQVYMPLMFGQYNPDIVYFNKSIPNTNFVYTKSAGRWRIHSYGPVCIYGSDVRAIGGLNTNIKGWGQEDVDFANRVMRRGLTIFRAPDQGIVHVYHQHIPCDESLKSKRSSCAMATIGTYAPNTEAVDYLIAKHYIE